MPPPPFCPLPAISMTDSVPPNAEPQESDLSGRTLGDFRLLRRLGWGAMAEVYLAEQCSLSRQVAVKVLKGHLAADQTYVKRFQREAQAAAALVHANIVQIHEVGCVGGAYYIAQEYVQGMNLRQWLTRHGSPDLRLTLLLMRQVSAALAKAAEQGIVHRDIKPENIMLSRSGEVKVADFGLAHLPAAQEVELTQAGTTLGTPLYMSPEQVEGKPLDPRSDLYSLGVTCYHMLAGVPPFTGDTALAVAVQHLKKSPPSLENIRPDLPPALCRIVHKLLAKAPENRYQTARELLKDLRQIQLECFGDHWPEEPLDWDAFGSTTTHLAPPNEATQRLAAVMHTMALEPPDRSSWRRWALGALAMFLVGAAAAALITRQSSLLASVEGRPLGVPKQATVGAQWLYASQLGTEESWRAVVEFFPDKHYWVCRAKQQLARIYLKEENDARAMAIFKEFSLFDDSEPELRAFGLAGQCWLLTKQHRFHQSAEALSQLLPIRSQLKDPLMRQMLNHAINKNLSELGPMTTREWQEWLERDRMEEGS
jgi:serine/threonine-protein kinase